MPLPANNTPWPPKPWDIAQAAWRLNEAWYLGDTDALSALYGTDRAHERRAPLRRGGVLGALTSFFWGRPVPTDQARTRLHIPAPADLATLSSDLMFSEPPEVKLATADKALQDRLDSIANTDEVHATWNQMGELKAAFGAAVITTQWDREVSEHPWLVASAADVAIPTFQGGRLVAVSLWTEYRDGTSTTVWRHLERHEPGRILHGLYQGTEQNLGRIVPLQDRPETEHLAALVNAEGAIPTGIPYLTASWNINMPSRAWRKQGVLAHAGRSDFQGIHGLFDMLDEAWSSWVRDLRLARARLTVPESWLDISGPGKGASVDIDQEIYSPVNAVGKDAPDPQLFQPTIRVDEHAATVKGLYGEILRAAGYSPSSWGEYDGLASTATEVNYREKASERTRDKKALYDKRAIAEQSRAALAIDAVLRGAGSLAGLELPEVTFPPASQQDPEKVARTIQLLDAAEAATTDTKVRMAHPDWDDDRVKQEVAGILAEQRVGDPYAPQFPVDDVDDEQPADDEERAASPL